MAANEENTPVGIAKKAVEDLLYFRDHYFELYSIDKAVQKNDDVKEKMTETFKMVETQKDAFTNKAEYFMLLGKTLNVAKDYDSKAEDYLSKAVKLDPKLVEAWNQLGELYWKKGDIHNSKNCLTGALVHSRNKYSLRNLSIVLRQLSVSTAEEQEKNIKDSVKKAKEAVQLDITDGQSWLILGNAYLALFFDQGQNPKVLTQVMGAYKQAEKDPVTKNVADFHYNRSAVFMFQENFQLALEGFNRTFQLDPDFDLAIMQEQKLLNYLETVKEMIENKGKVRGKRLQMLAKSPRDSALGPYGGGNYTSSSGKKIRLMRCSLKDLEPELNEEKVVLGKVACTFGTEDFVPFTFCLMDEDETCLPVTVFNLAQGCGVKIGDSVAIPEPYIQEIKVDFKGKVYDYKSIRVSAPRVLVVNGRKFAIDKEAVTVLVMNTLSD